VFVDGLTCVHRSLDRAGLWHLLVLDLAGLILEPNLTSGRKLSPSLLRKFGDHRVRIRFAAVKSDQIAEQNLD